MRDWRIGSLFSGIGGLELGLERAGLGRTAWQVEQDPFALQVLERHWPEAQRYTDVRDVGASNLQPVEILCGGFPCQDISQAGKGAGLQGERSGLWSEFARIIGEIRPQIVVVENVPMLIHRGLDRVLGDLAALGYDAEWDCIPAAAIGAPHLRDRIFIVAYPNGSRHFRGKPEIFPTETRFPAQREPVASGSLVAYTGSESNAQAGASLVAIGGERDARDHDGGGGRASRSVPGRWLPEPGMGRVVDGVPNRLDRGRCLGNAVVPQVAEYVGGLILKAAERETVEQEQTK